MPGGHLRFCPRIFKVDFRKPDKRREIQLVFCSSSFITSLPRKDLTGKMDGLPCVGQLRRICLDRCQAESSQGMLASRCLLSYSRDRCKRMGLTKADEVSAGGVIGSWYAVFSGHIMCFSGGTQSTEGEE